jgi:hypothetical protein
MSTNIMCVLMYHRHKLLDLVLISTYFSCNELNFHYSEQLTFVRKFLQRWRNTYTGHGEMHTFQPMCAVHVLSLSAPLMMIQTQLCS